MESILEKFWLIIGLILFFSIVIIFLLYKIKILFSKNRNKKENKKEKEISATNGKYVMQFLDDLIKKKYEYYLYKDILPVYVGNEFSKKEKFSKERFLEIKKIFFNDIFMSLSPEMKKEIVNLFSVNGIEIYIHQQFATYFNKTDAKFLNKEENIKDNMFFISETQLNKN